LKRMNEEKRKIYKVKIRDKIMANGENPERSYETSQVIGAVGGSHYKVGLPKNLLGRDLDGPRGEAQREHERNYRMEKEGRA